MLAAILIAGCNQVSAQTASFNYNLGSGLRTLRAFPIEHSDWVPKPVKLGNGTEVVPAIRSPRYPYYCIWREIDQAVIFSKIKDTGPPSKIFLMCSFGVSRWSQPSLDRLVELATERAKHEEAIIRMVWERRGAHYSATRFEIELHNPGRFSFRSQHFDEAQMAPVKIKVKAINIPSSPDKPFYFDLAISVPGKFAANKLSDAKKVISLSFTGSATPQPRWISG